MCGPDYRADLDLVFCHSDGDFILPGTVTKAVRRIAKKAGFTGVSIHTLRHSHGSQLLSAGVPLPAVSKRLGHTNIYVTATVYAHAIATDESAAAEKWEAAVNRTLNSVQTSCKHPSDTGVYRLHEVVISPFTFNDLRTGGHSLLRRVPVSNPGSPTNCPFWNRCSLLPDVDVR